MANPFKWFWYTATLRTKVLIIAPLLFVALLTAFWTFKGSLWVPEDSNEYKRLQGQNDQLREQNVELRKSYEDSIAHGQALELQRDGLAADLEKYGQQAKDGIKKQEEATLQYEKDVAIIGIDMPAMARCERYCVSRADAGYPCKPTADAYCKLRYGNAQP